MSLFDGKINTQTAGRSGSRVSHQAVQDYNKDPLSGSPLCSPLPKSKDLPLHKELYVQEENKITFSPKKTT